MPERLKNSGFWTFRFLVAPEELEAWMDYVINDMGMAIEPDSPSEGATDLKDTLAMTVANYRIFYDGLASPDSGENRSPFLRVWLTKEGFNNSIYLQKQFWFFDPPNENRISRDFFLELISPKGYQVDDPDGKHYDYHDIHEKEPLAKSVFDELTSPVKKITKPLYAERFGMLVSEYQIRISKQAWTDLSGGAFIRTAGQALRVK